MNIRKIGSNRFQLGAALAMSGVLAASALVLAACSGSGGSAVAPVTSKAAKLHGTVYGGRQPIVGATVTLYEAGLPGIGAVYADGITAEGAPTQIATTTTDASGNWSVATFSPAPTNGQVIYATATGGDAGSGPNSGISLLTIAGPFESLNFASSLNINELTTVAASALLPTLFYKQSCSAIAGNTSPAGASCVAIYGAPGKNSAINGLILHLGTFTNLVDPVSGQASTFLTANTGSNVQNATLDALENLDSLADILAACVNSPGGTAGDGSACGSLYSITGTTDTLSAALQIANNPSANVSALYGLLAPPLVYSPALSSAPANWTVGGQTFVYVENAGDSAAGDISAFTVNQTAGSASYGALTEIGGSPLIGPATRSFIGLSVNGKFLFAGNGNGVNVYVIDPIDARFVPTNGGNPFPTASSTGVVSQIVTDQTSRFAYALVANGDGNGNSQISAYTIDPATGALTLISTTPTPAGIGAYEISPFGSVNAAADLLLYVADTTNNQILGFNIDSTTGALSATPGSPFAAGSQPNYLTYSPANGGTIYSSNLGNSEIGVYQITAIGGVIGPLSPMAESSCGTTPDPGNCFSVAGNGSTSGIAVDASSQFLYVQNQSSGATYGLNIDSTLGTLSNLVSYPGTPYPNGDATDALDRFVFAANGNTNNITVYTLGDGGALTQVSGSPFAAANPAYGLANILVTP